MIGCSGFGGDTGGAKATQTQVQTPAPSNITLSKLSWCGKPLMVFRDNGAVATPPVQGTVTTTAASTPTVVPTGSAPKTLTDWAQVKGALDFSIYLPAMLPSNACLVSASGTIHDPVLGSTFTIGYLLADHSSITFSEAPLRSQGNSFQCSPARSGGASANAGTVTTGVLQLCTGVRNTTHIVFSARGTTEALQQMFAGLQADVSWVPVA